MRICLYTDTALPKLGGQEMVVDALARQFQDLGHEVLVLAPHPRLPMRANDRSLPYPVARHPRFYSTRRLVDWYRWWLLRAARRFRFDVLHCHGVYPPGYLAALTKARLQVPVLITSHGGDVRPGGVRQSKAAVKPRQIRAIQSAEALVSISRFTEQGFLFWGARQEQIVSIPNGVDLAPFARSVPRPADLDATIAPKQYALFLGRLAQRKGVDVLLQALASVAREGKIDLVIAGDGDVRAQLEQQTRVLNLENRVRFVGAVSGETKTWLLQNARCTVMPSRVWEAFPLVVLESYACGTPMLATQIPGLEDLVEPGRTGWLVPPESPQALAAALREALQDPTACAAMGRAGHDFAQGYSWRNIAQRHIELYETTRCHAEQKLAPSSGC
jgi:glycosyltransferase involved in cell wall biosynthesis